MAAASDQDAQARTGPNRDDGTRPTRLHEEMLQAALACPPVSLSHVRNDASVGPASNCPGLTLPPEGLDSQPGCFVSVLVPRGELGAWAASSDPQLCAAFAGFAKALQLIQSKRLLHPPGGPDR